MLVLYPCWSRRGSVSPTTFWSHSINVIHLNFGGDVFVALSVICLVLMCVCVCVQFRSIPKLLVDYYSGHCENNKSLEQDSCSQDG